MRDRDLVRLYWPAELRPAFDALFAIDDAMADVVAKASEPALGAIKLAWWREALRRLDHSPPPAEPRLQAAAAELLPRGVTGASLPRLEDGWLALLEPFPWRDSAMQAVTEHGEHLFNLASSLLGSPDKRIERAGALWALVDVARRCSDWPSRTHLLLHADELSRELRGQRFDRKMRPLTMLAALAWRDVKRGEPFEREGTPGRAAALIAHRLTGRVA